MNKFKKAILIGGGGIAALAGATYAIAGYMNNRVKLTADDWFTILGGDPDIEFNDCSNKTISTLEQGQIDKDMDRLNFTAFNFNSKSSENSARTIITDIITHWCKVHFVPGSKGAYVQGYDRYATLVLYKFLQTYSIEELLSNDTLKAKMDYVFECIMRVVVWGFNKYIPNDKSDPTIQQTKDDFTKNYGDTLFGILCYKIFVTRGTDDFSIQQHEIIWDIILSKIPPQNFFANQKMPSAVNTLYDNLMKKIFKQLDNSNIDNSNIFSERFRGVANRVLASSLPQEWDKIISEQGL